MKESSWKDCIEENSALNVSSNKFKANSLIETSKARISFIENNEINQDNANFIFEGYYSSITELLHAIILIKGFKVKNHICLGFYIKDVLNNRILFEKFDDCRYKRNSLLYYGKRMNFEIAKESIKLCKKIISDLYDYLEKENIK